MEAPITPICKRLAPALAAAAFLLPLGAAQADRQPESRLSAYLQARAAEALGDADAAARGYAALLAADPADPLLAGRAYAQALAGGEMEVALRAARTLAERGAGEVDLHLLLLAEHLRRRDWEGAAAANAAIAGDPVFGFMSRIVDAWMAADRGRGDPLALVAAAQANPMTRSYAAEHRPLILLALGRTDEALAGIRAYAGAADIRAQRLRIAGAAHLARKRRWDEALALLDGPGALLAGARKRVAARERLDGGVDSAAEGVAELLIRLAGDLQRQQVSGLAVRFARIAHYLAPDNGAAPLAAGLLMSALGQPGEALEALAAVDAADPYAPLALEARFTALSALGRTAEALALAEATAGEDADQIARLAELYSALGRHDEAAAAYARAIAAAERGEALISRWGLHLLRAAALEAADRWPEAKAELEAALALAPEEPVVLNYLGYGQLERRENIDAALAMVAKASALQPHSPEITDSLGWGYYLTGEIDKALELLERAARAAPDDPEINEHLGDAYYKAGRRYEARYAWRAALVYAAEADAARLRAKIDAGWTPALASP